MAIDLHNHSYYSDGQYSPSKVIENAVRDGLSAIALADHDCMWGLPEAEKKAEELNIDFVPGVELTVSVENDKDKADEIHILGLFVKPSDHLEDIHSRVKAETDAFSYKLAEALRVHKGFDIDVDRDIRKQFKGAISMGAFGCYLLAHGFIHEFKESKAIRKDLIAKGLLKEKPEFGISAAEAIEAIHEVDGLAFLAHPYRMKLDEQVMFERIKEYKKLGLDGLECHYKKYRDEEAEKIKRSLEIASILGLLISGGSDYHEDSSKGRFASGVAVPNSVLENLYRVRGIQKIRE